MYCRMFCLFWIVAFAVTDTVPGAEGKKAPGDDKLTLKTYDVRTLLSGVEAAANTEKSTLLDVCTSIISPKSWVDNGGEATLDIVGTRLRVAQSKAAHANIAALLAALKKLPRATRQGEVPAARLAAARLGPLLVGSQQVGKETMQIVVYPVADLVVPPGAFHGDLGALADQVRKTVAPKSWEENGGPGVIREQPFLLALVVSNTEQMQTQIAKLLAKFRGGGKAGRSKK